MIWRSPLDLKNAAHRTYIGKLVKVAGGIMNTHSREGDCRMEVLAAASVRNQVPYPVLEEILQCHHGRSSQETGCLWEKKML